MDSAGSNTSYMSLATGFGFAAAGLMVGLAAPKIARKIASHLKPGGKFSGVRYGSFSRDGF